jgi:hypothetical protein
MHRLAVLSLFLLAAACSTSGDDAGEGPVGGSEDPLAAKADAHWFYAGSLPKLEDVHVTVSLVGHTAHVRGTIPSGVELPPLAHLKTHGRRVDVVYPIATAAPGTSNAKPGTYDFQSAMPYKPNALATTVSEPTPHFVTWGGFPFLAYNGGIAFHGPITSKDNIGAPDMDVWFLRRGRVSGGCNRMNGEHVVELAHLIGVNMRHVYKQRETLEEPSPGIDVLVLNDYDVLDYNDGTPAKFIDVDYPTDDAKGASFARPQKVKGAENVVVFGSWIASETPDGGDLPKTMDGLDGKPYVFAEHVLPNTVCSYPPKVLKSLAKIASAAPGGELPKSLCEPVAHQCVMDAIGKSIKAGATDASIAQGAKEAAPCLGVTIP